MVPQTLSSKQPTQLGAPRLHARSMAACLLGLLGTSIACGGDIGDSDDVASLQPATSESADGQSSSGGVRGTASGSPGASGAALPGANLDTDEDERGIDDDDIGELDRVGSNSGSSGGGRRGGSVRRTTDDEPRSDAGVLDAGDVDGGDVDAGLNEEEDEEELAPDAGVADAGLAGDAGVLP